MILVCPTIDTEGVHGERPWEQFVLGEVGDSRSWGALMLAETFRRFGVQATFFVDVYESSFFGEARVADVCQQLLAAGQDVQLHTHPSWRDDPHDSADIRQMKRERSYFPQAEDFMAKLTLPRQIEILEAGIDFFTRHLGCTPSVHRSGGYSINADTVSALKHVGITVDSSMYRSHAHSEITWSANAIVRRDGMLELPVTILDYVFRVPPARRGVDLYSHTMKTDLDTCTLDELLWFVDASQEVGFGFVNLFLHSYSLLEFDGFYRRIVPEPADLDKLERFLDAVCRRSDVRVVSCAEVARLVAADPSIAERRDGIPAVAANRHIMELGVAKIRNRIVDLWAA